MEDITSASRIAMNAAELDRLDQQNERRARSSRPNSPANRAAARRLGEGFSTQAKSLSMRNFGKTRPVSWTCRQFAKSSWNHNDERPVSNANRANAKRSIGPRTKAGKPDANLMRAPLRLRARRGCKDRATGPWQSRATRASSPSLSLTSWFSSSPDCGSQALLARCPLGAQASCSSCRGSR